MKKEHKKVLKLGNHMRNMVGQPYYAKKPSDKLILEKILDGMSDFTGTCWNPVEKIENGKAVSFSIMLNQCPGACGHVWKIIIRDEEVASWLVNEINQRRWGEKKCIENYYC